MGFPFCQGEENCCLRDIYLRSISYDTKYCVFREHDDDEHKENTRGNDEL